jgi:hypothetical protein
MQVFSPKAASSSLSHLLPNFQNREIWPLFITPSPPSIPWDPSYRPHVSTHPPPTSWVGQSEQATWRAELGRGGGDGRCMGRMALGYGRAARETSRWSLVDRQSSTTGGRRTKARGDLADRGRATAEITPSPSCLSADKMGMWYQVLLGTA